ncbi:MAG: hypothetical protein IJH00_03780 [Erysipelotrichaceae bacterium]|nr:hypothetical protein [Erysipelotrichaceae bacterium]
MKNSVLRLTDEELEFARNRYPGVNFNEITMFADGMISMTNLDLLLLSIKADLNALTGDKKDLCQSIIDKAEYFKNHNCRNRLDGYDIDNLCEIADQMSIKVLNEKIGTDIFRIDQLINLLKSMREQIIENNMLDRTVMIVGIKFGTIMLEDKLTNLGYDWNTVEGYEYPCICNSKGAFKCDVLSFVKKKLMVNIGELDEFGNCTDFYYALLDSINKSID